MEWPKWKKRFERFKTASGLSGKAEEDQVNTLVYLMGDQAEDIFGSFNLSAADSKKYETVIKAFNSHFIVKKNVIYKRAKFNSRVQAQGESVITSIEDLHLLAEYCEYSTLREDLIRDRIVVGVADRRLSEKFQLEAQLTLKTATTKARQNEAVKSQSDKIHTGLSSVNRVSNQEVGTKLPYEKRNKFELPKKMSEIKGKPQNSRTGQCLWCGGNFHKKTDCPVKDKECNKCKKLGHFGKVCRSSSSTSTSKGGKEDLGSAYVGSVSTGADRRANWCVEVEVGGVPILFKLDPGADVTVIPLIQNVQFLKGKVPTLVPAKKRLFGPNRVQLPTVGAFNVTLKYDAHTVQSTVYVVRGLDRPLLGLVECEDLQLVQRVREVNSSTEVHPYKEYPKVFDGGQFDKPYSIKLVDDAEPYAVFTPRRVPIPLIDKLKTNLDKMVKMGVISPVEEPTDWCAPLVLAPKPNGDIRVCVDLTKLNKSVKRERHVMPSLESTLGKLKGAKIFSKLDATSGFWQVPLSEDSKTLTTFITPFGRFFFNRLPFAISSAPEHFQRRMCQLLDNIPGVALHTEDIFIFGSTVGEHDKTLRAVLKRLHAVHVTLNKDKCQFGVDVVSADGITPDPRKIEAIVDMDPPTDVQGVRRFLGLVTYVGRFVANLASMSQPLYELLKSEREFVWGVEQEASFNELKPILISDPILATFDPNRKTIVHTDASSYGLGAALIQLDEKKIDVSFLMLPEQ